MRQRKRGPPPAPIGPRGRVAGITTGAGLVVAGLAHAAGSWDELTTCPGVAFRSGRAEVGSQAVCDMLGAIGGMWFLMSLGVAILGALLLRAVLARPRAAGGPEGWTWGWSALFAIGGAIAATRLPSRTCPGDYRLDELFALCIGAEDRLPASSHLLPKGALALAALAIGVVLARVRWIPASVASVLALGMWLVGMGWFLLDTVGRDLVAG